MTNKFSMRISGAEHDANRRPCPRLLNLSFRGRAEHANRQAGSENSRRPCTSSAMLILILSGGGNIRKSLTNTFARPCRIISSLFDKYPHYIFNFSGANRYRMMKEYFPAEFAKVKQYVPPAAGFPPARPMEEGDVNAPSAEAIIRQILYGNNWFRKNLAKQARNTCCPTALVSGFASDHPGALGRPGFLHAKAGLGIFGERGGRESLRENAGRYAVQRRGLGRPRRRGRAGRIQSRQLTAAVFLPILARRCLPPHRTPPWRRSM